MKLHNLFNIALLCLASFLVEAQQVWTPDNGDGTFTNPLMWGDWPDPDIIRVDDDFYFISTSMHYVPGSPIATSKDLVNWKMVGYAVDRYDEDERYDMQNGQLYLNGSWANTIRYNNGKFYVGFCTPYGLGTETGHFPFVRQINRRVPGNVLYSRNIFTIRDCFSMITARYMWFTGRESYSLRN